MEVSPLISQPATNDVEAVLVPPTGLAQSPVKVLDQMSRGEPGPDTLVTVVRPSHPDTSVGVTVSRQPRLQLAVLQVRLDDSQGSLPAQAVAELHGSEPVQLEMSIEITARAHWMECRGAECL